MHATVDLADLAPAIPTEDAEEAASASGATTYDVDDDLPIDMAAISAPNPHEFFDPELTDSDLIMGWQP